MKHLGVGTKRLFDVSSLHPGKKFDCGTLQSRSCRFGVFLSPPSHPPSGRAARGRDPGAAAHFLFLGYRALPDELWGTMPGVYAKVSLVAGIGVFNGRLGWAQDVKQEYVLFAVGAGLDIGAGAYLGGAWLF